MPTIELIISLLKKIKKTFDITAAVSVSFILFYRINGLRSLCKSFLVFLSKYCTFITTPQLIHIYNDYVERILFYIVVFYIAYIILLTVIQLIYDYLLKSVSGNSSFEQSLLRYINDDTIPRCYVLTGEWGSGKTHATNYFFEKYYANSRKKVFRISCYGLETRKDLVGEIERTIKKQDSSLSATIVKGLTIIPVVGDALEKIFKKTYGYDSVKKGSIFIFDDFERIVTPFSIQDYRSDLYTRSRFLPGTKPRVNNDTEKTLNSILKEFSVIEASNRNIESLSLQLIERQEMEKYNIIAGLINDLIEKYSMKAIIICNTNILGERFVNETLQEKLNCIVYRKHAYPQAKSALIDNILNNRLLSNEAKNDRVKQFVMKVKESLCSSFLGTEFENLRLFGNILEAFIITADLLDVDDLSDSFLISLLNSIIIVHRVAYEQNPNHLNTIKNGASIKFFIKLYDLAPATLIEFENTELKWVDLSLSSYWIFNLPAPTNVKVIIDDWTSYDLYETDLTILKSSCSIDKITELNLYHVLYAIKFGSEEKDYSKLIKATLENYDLTTTEELQYVLDILGDVFPLSYPHKLDTILNTLVPGHEHDNIAIKTQIHQDFEYLQRRINESSANNNN